MNRKEREALQRMTKDMAKSAEKMRELGQKMAVAMGQVGTAVGAAAQPAVYTGNGTWYTAGTGTADWAWTNTGTTAGNWITYNEPTTVEFQTNTISANHWRDLWWGGNTPTRDPMWERANETQEEKERRERAEVYQIIARTARAQGYASWREADAVFDFEHIRGLAARDRYRDGDVIREFVPTPDEERELEDAWQRRREERIAQERRRVADAREQAIASRRAELLLHSLLSAEQKRELLENHWVTEVAPSGRRWRLTAGWAGSVCIMDEENPTVRRATLCIHGRDWVPGADNMVMLLMTIRGDENRVIRTAILHGGSWSEEESQIRLTRQADLDAAQRAADLVVA